MLFNRLGHLSSTTYDHLHEASSDVEKQVRNMSALWFYYSNRWKRHSGYWRVSIQVTVQELTIAGVSIQISALSKASTALSRVDTDVETLTETIFAVHPHICQMRSFNRGNQEYFHLNDLASLKLVPFLSRLLIDSVQTEHYFKERRQQKF